MGREKYAQSLWHAACICGHASSSTPMDVLIARSHRVASPRNVCVAVYLPPSRGLTHVFVQQLPSVSRIARTSRFAGLDCAFPANGATASREPASAPTLTACVRGTAFVRHDDLSDSAKHSRTVSYTASYVWNSSVSAGL